MPVHGRNTEFRFHAEEASTGCTQKLIRLGLNTTELRDHFFHI
jgi:hypothetical protein